MSPSTRRALCRLALWNRPDAMELLCAAHALAYQRTPVAALHPMMASPPCAHRVVFGAMKAIPASILGDRELMQSFSLFSEPIIRLVDKLVGATNAMRVDAYGKDGRQVCMRAWLKPRR